MRRFVKPWLFAFIIAFSLHGLFFVWFKDRHWGIHVDQEQNAHLNVSLLPKASSDNASAAAQENTAVLQQNNSAGATQTDEAATISPSATTTVEPPNQTPEIPPTSPQTKGHSVSLAEIDKLQQNLDRAPDNWKQGSLLDIGSPKTQEKLDTAKAAFSPAFRQALSEAKSVQAEYAKGIIEHEDYAITEDADGTRYVNIKGVCWKLPEPGTYGEWQVVLSGCSGQKDTFRFELNITTDILRSDVFEDLPFTLPE